MAEADIPKIAPSDALTREKSSLSESDVSVEKVEAITKGVATPAKKSFGAKLKETFIADDARDVGEYIMWDIVIPAIKMTIYNVVVGSAGRIFLGNSQPPAGLSRRDGVTRIDRDRPSFSYSTVSTARAEAKRTPAMLTAPKSNNYDILDFEYDDRQKLEQAFDEMVNALDEYGRLTLDEYAEILSHYFSGIPKMDYTANSWGWRSLSSASIVVSPGGYFLKMPKPMPIKG